MREQASKFFAEVQIRFDQRVGFGVEIRQIDRVAHSAPHQIVGDRLGHFNADVFLRLLRARAEMRCHDHLRKIAQGKFFRQRLHFINVQRRAGHSPALDRIVKVVLMDDAASGGVEHAHPFLHLRKRRGVDHTTRLVAHWHMDGDEISAGVDFVKLHQFHLQRLGARQRQIRVVGQHPHAEGDGAPGDFASDAAHAEDAERFVVKFDALKFLAVPLTRFHGTVRLRNFPRQRHQHRECQLGGRDRVAAGGVHHHDATLRLGLDIHVIGTHAGAPHDAKLWGRLDDIFRHFGFGPHDHRGNFADQREQFGFGQPRFQDCYFELGLLLQQGDSLRRNEIANHHVHKAGRAL